MAQPLCMIGLADDSLSSESTLSQRQRSSDMTRQRLAAERRAAKDGRSRTSLMPARSATSHRSSS